MLITTDLVFNYLDRLYSYKDLVTTECGGVLHS